MRSANVVMGCLVVCAACGSKKNEAGAGSGAAPAGGETAGGEAAGSAAADGATGSAGAADRLQQLMPVNGELPRLAIQAAPGVTGVAGMAALANERKTRIFECAFAKAEGEGKDKKILFSLKNLGERKAQSAQSWIYYYDEAGKLVGRYPHRFGTTLEPGATEEQALGHEGERLPKTMAAAECEISEVSWADKSTWENANLASYAIDRPRGGLSHAQLMEREGERVTASWNGKLDGKRDGEPALALKNISARPVTATVIWAYQYDAKGALLDRGVHNVAVELAPGAEAEYKLGPKPLKPGAKYVEAVVSQLSFRDGAREKWLNDNLAPLSGRPMKGPIADAAATP